MTNRYVCPHNSKAIFRSDLDVVQNMKRLKYRQGNRAKLKALSVVNASHFVQRLIMSQILIFALCGQVVVPYPNCWIRSSPCNSVSYFLNEYVILVVDK